LRDIGKSRHGLLPISHPAEERHRPFRTNRSQHLRDMSRGSTIRRASWSKIRVRSASVPPGVRTIRTLTYDRVKVPGVQSSASASYLSQGCVAESTRHSILTSRQITLANCTDIPPSSSCAIRFADSLEPSFSAMRSYSVNSFSAILQSLRLGFAGTFFLCAPKLLCIPYAMTPSRISASPTHPSTHSPSRSSDRRDPHTRSRSRCSSHPPRVRRHRSGRQLGVLVDLSGAQTRSRVPHSMGASARTAQACRRPLAGSRRCFGNGSGLP
jgi:hypothetical protein